MKSPALLLALFLALFANSALAQGGFEASTGWRFLDLHFMPKPAPLIPPALSAAERAACGDINAAEMQCAAPRPEVKNYRIALQSRRRTLETKITRIDQYPHTYDVMDLQLALTRSGLSSKQIPPALMRKIKMARFAVSWRGHRHNRPQALTFPY